VYLVVEVTNETDTQPADVSRDFGDAILVFDAVDKKSIRAKCRQLVSAALAATALAVTTTSDLVKVQDGVELVLPDGRPLHSVTFSGGAARLSTARPVTELDLQTINSALRVLSEQGDLETPCRLLVDALQSGKDRLEGFIFAWAAMEMIVRKYTVSCEDGLWVDEVASSDHQRAADFHLYVRVIRPGWRCATLAHRGLRLWMLPYPFRQLHGLAFGHFPCLRLMSGAVTVYQKRVATTAPIAAQPKAE
jgi:hypothetical protein